MAQDKVTRKELLDMFVGQTRIFMLKERTKLHSTAVTANRLKKERMGTWECRKDYDAISISVTRVK